MAIVVRKAGFSDLPQLTRIAHAAKRHWGYPDALLALWVDDLTVTAKDLGEDLVFCAGQGEGIAGFYSVSGDGSSRELEHMWVLPEYIGTGVGRVLFEHMIDQLRKTGVDRLRIVSDPNATGFYEKMGARRIGDVPATPAGRTLPLLEVTIAH